MNGRRRAWAAALLSLLTWVSAVQGREATRLEVRVTVPAPSGSAGEVLDVGLTGALAQALIDAGLPASRARDLGAPCQDGCLRVLVQRRPQEHFLIEVRAPGETERAQLQLGASASAFDLAHALAIEVEVLAERTRSHGRRLGRAVPGATTPVAVPLVRAAAADDAALPRPPEPPPPAGPTVVDSSLATVDETSALNAGSPSAPSPTIDDARLALDVAALMLAAVGDDQLFMVGSTVAARVRITRGGELLAGIAFLRPEHRGWRGTSYRRELLPLQLAFAGQVPHVSALRVGLGVEAILIGVDEADRERPSSWSLGAIGRVEYRYPIHSFALLAVGQTALHPAEWCTGPRHPQPLVGVPPWTMSLALGLELTIF